MSLSELLGVFPAIEPIPASQTVEKGFPQSLDRAVREPESRGVESPNNARRTQQQRKLTTRPETADLSKTDRAEERRTQRASDDGVISDPQLEAAEVVDPMGVDDAAPEAEPDLSVDEPQTMSEALYIAEVDVDLTVVDQDVEQDVEQVDETLLALVEPELDEESTISQASLLDLEGLAQFLDAVPVQDGGTDPTLAEIVSQLLVEATPEEIPGSDAASSEQVAPPDTDGGNLDPEELPVVTELISLEGQASLTYAGGQAPSVVLDSSSDVAREATQPRADVISVPPEAILPELLLRGKVSYLF
ncbi:MAG: hypothetical protein ACC652_00380, partial [Acidimicrobiales bacterium]